jgi:hypothetical protein
MDICVRLFCVCVVYVGSGADPPSKESYQMSEVGYLTKVRLFLGLTALSNYEVIKTLRLSVDDEVSTGTVQMC